MRFGGVGNAFGRMGEVSVGGFDPLSLFTRYNASGLYIPHVVPHTTNSGLVNAYQDNEGTTAADADSDPVGLLLDESQGAALGAELVPADYTTVWSDSANIDVQTTQIVASAAHAESTLWLSSVVQDAFYKIVLTVSGFSQIGGDFLNVRLGASNNTVSSITADGEYSFLARAAGGSGFGFHAGGSGTSSSWTITGVSLKRVAGNHAYQSTDASRLTLVNDAGPGSNRWALQGDGVADHEIGTLVPASAFSMAAFVDPNAVSDTFIGASVGTNFIKLGTHSDGLARAYVGTTTQDLTAATVVDVPGVAWMGASGSTFDAGWVPLSGSAETVTGVSFSGAIPTTQAPYLMAENNDGTAETWMAGEGLSFFEMQARWSVAEALAVANHMIQTAGL